MKPTEAFSAKPVKIQGTREEEGETPIALALVFSKSRDKREKGTFLPNKLDQKGSERNV